MLCPSLVWITKSLSCKEKTYIHIGEKLSRSASEEDINFKSHGVPFLSPTLVPPFSSPKPDSANFCYIITKQERRDGPVCIILSLHCVTLDARCTAHFCHSVTLSGWMQETPAGRVAPIKTFFGTLSAPSEINLKKSAPPEMTKPVDQAAVN